MDTELQGIKKDVLEDYFQFVTTIIGTKGVKQKESEFRLYTKDELIKRLQGLLPEEHKYSVLTAADEKEKGI